MKITNEDLGIIDVLKKDSSLSIRSIAAITKMPVTTVHNHIKKLKREGIIKRYSVELDMKKLGKEVTAWILVNTSPQHTDIEASMNELIKHENVELANTLAGRYDFILRLRTKNIDELNKFLTQVLRKHENIQRTETFVELHSAEKE